MSENQVICPSCGKPLPPGVTLGLCPACLVKSGLGTGPEPGGKRPDFVPPSVAEIASLFPQYEILGFIGQGGMGAVYQARQPALDRFVALKILAPHLATDPGFAERFSREARALARLNHPNIVTVYDFGQAGVLYYLVMEFVDGQNLRQLERGGRLLPKQALQIVPQICDALQFAHEEGIVHRDIKPENILLDQKGRVKITDFGIAKIAGATPEKVGLTGARDIVGTPHYMAPEQIEKPNAVDHRADIYSLGVVFYELLTGELPLGKFSPPSARAVLDVRFDGVVLRALEKDPERRYQHASEVKADTQVIASSPPPLPPPPPIRSQTPTPPPLPNPAGTGNRWKFTVMAAVVAVVLLVFAVGIFLILGRSAVKPRPQSATAPVAPLPGTGSQPSTAPATDAPALQYHWVAGESYVYAVQFQSDKEAETETLAGNVIYHVKEVNGRVATLTYQHQMGMPQHHAKPGHQAAMFPPAFWPESPFSAPHEIQVDSTGGIQERSGQSKALPQALGNVEDLIIEPLPAHNQSAWVAEGDCVIWQTQIVPFSPMSTIGRKVRTNFPAHEKTSYQIISTENSAVRIQKHYDLQTEEQVAGQPRMQLTGEGTLTFDAALGLPRSLEFKGVFTETTSNLTSRTPVTLSYRLLAGVEKTKALSPPTPAKVELKELTAAELQDALLDLKSDGAGRKQWATATLAGAKPTEPRDEVVSALIPALGDSNWAVRQNATRALGVWATTEARQPLVKMLADTEFSVRWAAVDALTNWPDAETAVILAGNMARGTDVSQASRALRTIGAPAEAAVDGLLTAQNQQARYEACRILKDIGTRQSIPALTKAAGDADGITAMLAKSALHAVQIRR